MAFAWQNWFSFPSTDRMFLIQTAPRFRRKNRVRNSRHTPSGRRWGRGRVCSMSTPGFRRYTYQTVPGRSGWPSRDPLGESGFENFRAAGAIPRMGKIASPISTTSNRWIRRNSISETKEPNRYGFVKNNPIELVDNWGLFATLDTSGCKDHASEINAAWQTAIALMQKALDDNFQPSWDPSIFQRMSDDTQKVSIKCGGCWGWIKCKLAGNPPAVIGLSSVYLCRDKLSPCLLAATLAVEVSKVDCGVTALGAEIPFSDWLHIKMCPNEKW